MLLCEVPSVPGSAEPGRGKTHSRVTATIAPSSTAAAMPMPAAIRVLRWVPAGRAATGPAGAWAEVVVCGELRLGGVSPGPPPY